MRPPSPSLAEKEFLFTSLEQSLRLDGRALLEQRTPEFIFGEELGSVEVSLGKTRCVAIIIQRYDYTQFMTRVLAVVEGKMVRPTPDRPFEGAVTIHSEISPMASSEYEPGR